MYFKKEGKNKNKRMEEGESCVCFLHLNHCCINHWLFAFFLFLRGNITRDSRPETRGTRFEQKATFIAKRGRKLQKWKEKGEKIDVKEGEGNNKINIKKDCSTGLGEV